MQLILLWLSTANNFLLTASFNTDRVNDRSRIWCFAGLVPSIDTHGRAVDVLAYFAWTLVGSVSSRSEPSPDPSSCPILAWYRLETTAAIILKGKGLSQRKRPVPNLLSTKISTLLCTSGTAVNKKLRK